jgi:glycine cleavage system aminomethyltransferase T
MTLENNPYQVGLDRLVDADKEQDYMGKEALARVASQGVDRRLVGIEIAGDRLSFNDRKWVVRDETDQTVGTVTSALYSPRLERNIGYAWVPVERAGLGQRLTIETPVGVAVATVVPMPFVDPTKEIPKS